MRAVVVDRWMDSEELRVSDAPEPTLVPGSVSIDVKAAGCNFYDTLICQGKYQVKPPFPFVPGGEIAGIVHEVGEGVTGFAPGDRVCAQPWTGGFAERAVAQADSVWPIPESMTFAEGAALPIVYGTSYAALVYRANAAAGETLLVHAAAGGVGLAAVQIGKALGMRVFGTAGGAEKLQIVRDAGAEIAIDYREEDFVEVVSQATDGKGADVIYESVGGDVFDRSLKCIAWNGRLLVIGFAGGTIPQLAVNRVLLKNIAVVGLHWAPYGEHEPDKVRETFRALFEMVEDGRIRPRIHEVLPLEQVSEALRQLKGRKVVGKIVLEP